MQAAAPIYKVLVGAGVEMNSRPTNNEADLLSTMPRGWCGTGNCWDRKVRTQQIRETVTQSALQTTKAINASILFMALLNIAKNMTLSTNCELVRFWKFTNAALVEHCRGWHTCAMSENESSALHALCKDSNIVISKPDKGNGVVVLNRADYVAKMQTILCDTNCRGWPRNLLCKIWD